MAYQWDTESTGSDAMPGCALEVHWIWLIPDQKKRAKFRYLSKPVEQRNFQPGLKYRGKEPDAMSNPSPVLELRVALTTSDYERLFKFYTAGLGLEPAALWTTPQTHGVLFELGRATVEVFDEPHAESVDQIEVGRRVSGPVRLALQVPDVDAAVERLLAAGATLVHPPVVTPWGDRNARLQDPDGMQITLFQSENRRSGEPSEKRQDG